MECNDPPDAPPGTLCLEEDDDQALDQNGQPILLDAGGDLRGVELDQLGSIDRTSQDAKSYGGAGQAVDKTALFGLPNQFLIGASYDHGEVYYGANSELGFFLPKFVVNSFDPPILSDGPRRRPPAQALDHATTTSASTSPTRPI